MNVFGRGRGASAVRLQQIEDVVRSSLPYCDLELQLEPDMPAMP